MCRKFNQKEEPLQQEQFDDYMKRRSSFYKLKPIPSNRINSEFVHFSCSCPHYQRKAYCKHGVAVGIWREKFRVPVEMSIAALGPKGKRGRKKKLVDVCFGATANSQPKSKHTKTSQK
jgi:hypothetical protein